MLFSFTFTVSYQKYQFTINQFQLEVRKTEINGIYLAKKASQWSNMHVYKHTYRRYTAGLSEHGPFILHCPKHDHALT